jgi:hypothetical protein
MRFVCQVLYVYSQVNEPSNVKRDKNHILKSQLEK